MTLLCDACDEEIEDQTRPEAAVPTSGGFVDLCRDCKESLRELMG